MANNQQQQMMRQLRKMQAQMEEAQAKTVEASAGGGMVNVVVGGDLEIKSLTIDPEAVDPEDVEMLQDTIIAAVNEGMRQAQQLVASAMPSIPGMGGMPGFF